MKITRDVVSDLWPVYEAGEASADTRALVDEFLAGDPAFAETLRGAARVALPSMEAPMSINGETQALERTRDLVSGRGWLRGVRLFALVMTVFAVKRLLQEPSWPNGPGTFIGEAVMAAAAWSLYTLALMHQRRKVLRG